MDSSSSPVPPVPVTSLFRIELPVLTTLAPFRASNIVFRNLHLRAGEPGKMGIELMAENSETTAVSSDLHFNSLTIEGFDIGLYAGYREGMANPMIDGVSLKGITYIDNENAAEINSSNISNWNVMDTVIQSDVTDANGWYQTYGGHVGLQDISCEGASEDSMLNCVRFQMAGGAFVNGFKQSQNVANALTIDQSYVVLDETIYEAYQPTTLVLRNSDFTEAEDSSNKVNIQGKSFITSMNNKYTNFDISTSNEADESRLTYCGDSYAVAEAYADPGAPTTVRLADDHENRWVGVRTQTRIECGTDPIPWEETFNLGGWTGDVPLVGNVSDATREDFILYRPGSTGKFMIQEQGETAVQTINHGTSGEIGVIGNFFPGSRSQLVAWGGFSGSWDVHDPTFPSTPANNPTWYYGTGGDIPLTGNFLDESGSVSGNMDEVAVYRPSTKVFWIANPRAWGVTSVFATAPAADSKILVGDFLGLGYDQIAQVKAGSWVVTDPQSQVSSSAVTFGNSSDQFIAGNFLGNSCTQMGYWNPASETLFVQDHPSCGSASGQMLWGSNNNYLSNDGTDDIILSIFHDVEGLKPVAYRPDAGPFTESTAAGQWWVHDAF